MRKRPNTFDDQQITPFKKQRLLQSPPSVSNPSVSENEFVLTKDLVENAILHDLMDKPWRIGKPIGKGSFGEIFLASDVIHRPVTNENAKYVAKIEPHSNGPLFVEIHCLLNTAKKCDERPLPIGMSEYIASGSHYFQSNRYRFLILQRFQCDLQSIIRNRRVGVKHILIIALQVIDVLNHLHEHGYAHSDIKAENLMIGSIEQSKLAQNKITNESRNRNNFRNNYCQQKPLAGNRRQLRPPKNVKYIYDDDESNDSKSDDAKDLDFCREKKNKSCSSDKSSAKKKNSLHETRSNHIYLIDFGLALKFVDSNGVHHPFCMDQRRAHDGTLEFTSRDAHMGAHSRRSDLECLGYNMMFWCLGSLPWKDKKLQNQPEQVHRMKEIFMTDAREMIRLIYGQTVPKFIGDYLHYVNSLAYDEKPDYEKIRLMFIQEFTNLGYKASEMVLDVEDLRNSCVEVSKAEKCADNHSDKIKNVKSIAKLGLLIPIHDKINNTCRNVSIGGSNSISPKNLRSKTDKIPKKKRTRFSWAEILSQDPDQIARQRAEKEFERDQLTETPIKYKGRPTYAILEIENKLKSKDNNNTESQPSSLLKGYNKAMMDVVRRRKQVVSQCEANEKFSRGEKEEEPDMLEQKNRRARRKSENPTKLSMKNSKNSNVTEIHANFYIRPKTSRKSEVYTQQLTPPNTTDESSCSSIQSSSSERNQKKKGSFKKKTGSTGTNSRSSSSSSLNSAISLSGSGSVKTYYSSDYYDDEEETSCDMKNFSPVKTRRTRPKRVNQSRGKAIAARKN